LAVASAFTTPTKLVLAIVAWLVEHLERSGFVIMKRPPIGSGRGARARIRGLTAIRQTMGVIGAFIVPWT